MYIPKQILRGSGDIKALSIPQGARIGSLEVATGWQAQPPNAMGGSNRRQTLWDGDLERAPAALGPSFFWRGPWSTALPPRCRPTAQEPPCLLIILCRFCRQTLWSLSITNHRAVFKNSNGSGIVTSRCIRLAF